MIRRDSRCFWASIRNYVKLHPDEAFPLHAQEAYIMYMDKAPEEKQAEVKSQEDEILENTYNSMYDFE